MSDLTKLIAPSFYGVHHDIKAGRHTHYWLKGGRGSTKSSFISVEIILGMMQDTAANALVLRKVAVNLKDSVYEQLLWAIEALGVEHLWKAKLSPLQLSYLPTGQRILFRGADEPKKIKSTKFRKGYCKYIWYEEADEFAGNPHHQSIPDAWRQQLFCILQLQPTQEPKQLGKSGVLTAEGKPLGAYL